MFIERLAVTNAATEKRRPFWNGWQRVRLLWQQRPKFGMVPTQFMSRTVTMCADPTPEFCDFFDEFFARHSIEIFVHDYAYLPTETPLNMTTSNSHLTTVTTLLALHPSR